jgi:hypothetical protein
MIPGDLVRKKGWMERGQIGLVVLKQTNTVGHTLLTVLKFNGHMSIWYANTCCIVDKI